jgi:hypothetical protein
VLLKNKMILSRFYLKQHMSTWPLIVLSYFHGYKKKNEIFADYWDKSNVATLGPVYSPSSKFIWPVVAMI